MNRSIGIAAWMLGLVSAGIAAEASFTGSLAAPDFAAAGLSRLSAAELARLDALVREYTARTASAPSGSSAMPATDPTVANRRSRPSPDAAAPVARGTRAQPKVTVAAGTTVEFTTVESRIAGEFTGWSGRTVFTLENGQRWQTDASSSYVGVRLQNPVVKVVPGMFGSYWMSIEGVRPRVKVTPVGAR